MVGSDLDESLVKDIALSSGLTSPSIASASKTSAALATTPTGIPEHVSVGLVVDAPLAEGADYDRARLAGSLQKQACMIAPTSAGGRKEARICGSGAHQLHCAGRVGVVIYGSFVAACLTRGGS